MIRLAQLGVFVAFAALWEIAARTFADPFYISSPALLSQVLMEDLFKSSFYNDLRVTFVELFLGFTTGAIGGILTAILFGRWPLVARIFDPFLVALNSIPRIALAPLFVIWFGIDLASKVVLAATLVYFLTFFNTLSGIRAAEPRFINVARRRRLGLAGVPSRRAARCDVLDYDRLAHEPALRADRRDRR